MQLLRSRVAALGLLAAVALAPACQRGTYQPQAQLAPVTAQPVGPAIPANAQATGDHCALPRASGGPNDDRARQCPHGHLATKGESPLANLVGDIQQERAASALGEPIALGVMTNGGLRAPIPAGPVTLGSMFELMPFENELVVLDAPGAVVQELFRFAAPIRMAVSGAVYTVDATNQPSNILIGGKPFNPAQTYTIAISDYLAGGGDNMGFFKALKPRGTGVLLRTAIADYIKAQTQQGKPLEARVEGRVKL